MLIGGRDYPGGSMRPRYTGDVVGSLNLIVLDSARRPELALKIRMLSLVMCYQSWQSQSLG